MIEVLAVYLVIATMFSFAIKGFVSKGLIREQEMDSEEYHFAADLLGFRGLFLVLLVAASLLWPLALGLAASSFIKKFKSKQ